MYIIIYYNMPCSPYTKKRQSCMDLETLKTPQKMQRTELCSVV